MPSAQVTVQGVLQVPGFVPNVPAVQTPFTIVCPAGQQKAIWPEAPIQVETPMVDAELHADEAQGG
ncbi:MAG: hypothetical protein COU67_00030 [Candidatus Pacebacteria bacterium CG10_big_fil_rev_8_21_14_0_10_44_54]|nr:MAG: hypothetical protein COU67_00030 [Candidatus Pacebacteria bacterium CG10_big_fil_rev_8_21_14_0_10_44_54]